MTQSLDDAFRFHQTALSLRSSRQELLASNIANADTPRYQARDMDFSAALRTALGQGGGGTLTLAAAGGSAGRSSGATLSATSPLHLPGNPGRGPGGATLLYRKAVQDSVDGNTVDMDVERSAFASNAIHYEATITQLTGQIKTLLAAIQS